MANLDFSITEEEQNEVVNKLANLCGEDTNRLFSAVATSLSSKLLTHAPNQPGINDPEFVSELAQLEIYTKAIMLTNGIDKIQFQTEILKNSFRLRKKRKKQQITPLHRKNQKIRLTEMQHPQRRNNYGNLNRTIVWRRFFPKTKIIKR